VLASCRTHVASVKGWICLACFPALYRVKKQENQGHFSGYTPVQYRARRVQAASCTKSTSGPCAGPPTMSRRLCQVWLHHVFTSPLEVLGPAWQVQTSCFSGTCFCKNRCWDLSCHGRRIGQDPPDRPRRGPIAIPCALYKRHPRVLKSDIFFWFDLAPKLTPLNEIV